MDYECRDRAVIDPELADAMAGECRLLRAIDVYEPSVVRGPLLRNRQDWTSIGRRCWPSTGKGPPPAPAETRFIVPRMPSALSATTQPTGLGLYTSTGVSGGLSTWRRLLSGYEASAAAGGGLYPFPWVTWRLEPSTDKVSVAEIVSARTWVAFVESYSAIVHGTVWPDWARIAEEFDAIHITLSAVVAAQGFRFRVGSKVIAPAFWDVEQTFWLAWRFSGAQLLEIVPDNVVGTQASGIG